LGPSEFPGPFAEWQRKPIVFVGYGGLGVVEYRDFVSHLCAPYDACSPRCGSEALDQKIDEGPHLGSLMMAWRHQSKQRIGFRVLGVLQQGLQQSFADGRATACSLIRRMPLR
jgi:hypothetical protein